MATPRSTSRTKAAAAAAAAEPAAPAFDPDALYDVTLNRVVLGTPVGDLSPGKVNHLRGSLCILIADAIADAKPV